MKKAELEKQLEEFGQASQGWIAQKAQLVQAIKDKEDELKKVKHSKENIEKHVQYKTSPAANL